MNQTRINLVRLVVASLAMMVSPYCLAQAFPDLGASSFKRPAGEQAADGPKVRLSTEASPQKAAPGKEFVVAVKMSFAKGWHAWPSAEQDVLPPDIAEFAIRTSLVVPSRPGWIGVLGRTQWPEPQPGKVADFNNPGQTITVPLYQDAAMIFVPILVSPDAPIGPATLTFTVGYQACDETLCEAPEEKELTISLEIAPDGGAFAGGPAFRSFDASVFERMRSGADVVGGDQTPTTPGTPASPITPAGSTFFGVSLAGLTGPMGFLVLAALGAVGGFILNLTPCVLPVIPIKILTLVKQAGSPRRSLVLGAFMALGVIAFWLALGVPAAFVSAFADPSRLFGIWWLTTGIGLLIGLMGLGILGLFSINLPQAVYMVNPEAESPAGSFFFGVMTAVLGLPCFGFVAGALLPAAATFGPASTIVIFGAMGVGMALPYFVLAAKPHWLDRLPRTGPASELVKQVMGLLLLAAAAYFVGSGLIALVQDAPYIGTLLHWWAAAVFGALAGLWLMFRTFQITTRSGPRFVFTIVGLVIGGVALAAAQTRTASVRDEYEKQYAALAGAAGAGPLVPGVWLHYSEALHERARREKKVIVLDFTAEWCLNCKTLKAAVLDRAPVKPALESSGAVLFEVDLTSTKAPGWERLRALGQTGIPLLVVEGPGLKEPWLSNAYTSDQVLRALESARGR
ncbi:MAG: thioredoxin family protein [Phycisphaerae bacterium]|nr:thioredoxin family protein [Phycisphaerae bacterium]